MKARLALLGVLLAFILFAPTTSGQPPGAGPTMRVHFMDVGQGAATLVEFPCANVLIDTGGESNGDFDSTVALMDYLDTFFSGRPDKTLASLILTHPHIDHTRGVSAVLEKYKVRNAVTNGQETGSGKFGQIALHKKPSYGALALTPAGLTPAEHVSFSLDARLITSSNFVGCSTRSPLTATSHVVVKAYLGVTEHVSSPAVVFTLRI